MHEKNIISSENRSEASGEINPNRNEQLAQNKDDIQEEIHALEMQKKTAGKNIESTHAKMKEIQEGPKTEAMHDINLQLLNALQSELSIYQERYNSLGRQVAEKKLELRDM